MNKKGLKILITFVIIFIIFFGAYNIVKDKFLKTANKTNNISYKTNKKTNNKNSIGTVKVNKIIKDREFTGDIIYNNNYVPVLMYHSIDYEKGNELRVPKELFKKHMKYLKDNGYTTITMNEFYKFINDNKPVPRKSVVITFDDGYKDNYVNAYPILKEFGFKATIFVITSNIDKEKRCLSSAEIKEMNENGIDIESHTVNHDKLAKLSYDKQMQTLKASKDSLEKILNKKEEYIAYPYGSWNENTINAVKSSGYKLAFVTESGWSNKNQGVYTLHRVYISANHDVNEFKRRVTNPEYYKSE